MRKTKGITLIALVITIIVLLILAGVSLNLIAGTDGILGKASSAREKTIKAQYEEEINLVIIGMRTDAIDKKDEFNMSYVIEKLPEYLEAEGKLDYDWDIEDTMVKMPEGEYKGYLFYIDEDYVAHVESKVGEKPAITLTVDTTDIGASEVTITASATISDDTIAKIIKPDGTEISGAEATFTVNKSGSYVFKAVSSTGKKGKNTIDIVNIKPATPEISIIQEGGYPLFTDMDVKVSQGIVEIKYDESNKIKNYYREDSGEWKLYTGRIATSATKIEAKSVVESESNLESEIAEKTLTIVQNYLRPESYDDNEETVFAYPWENSVLGRCHYAQFLVDESTWNKNMNIKFRIFLGTTGYARQLNIAYLDSNNGVMKINKTTEVGTGVICNTVEIIPENTKSVIIFSDLSLEIYELSIKSYGLLEYPILTSDGIKNVRKVEENKITYVLDFNVGDCFGNFAAPKKLFDGNLDESVKAINYAGFLFKVDSSAVGTTWKINGNGDIGTQLVLCPYKDFRSDGHSYPFADIYNSTYALEGGVMDTITITEEMKYLGIRATYTEEPIVYEVYKME